MNGTQRGKLLSSEAVVKSYDNGFHRGDHRGVAAKIADAWQWAAEQSRAPGKRGGNSPDVRRYLSAIQIGEQDAFAYITVKDTQDGLRIYSVELMDAKKASELAPSGNPTGVVTTLLRSYDEVITRLNEPVKKESTRQAGTSSQTLTQTADGGAPTPESILLTAKGAMTRSPETGQALISLFKGKSDVSTIIHEGAGHFFLENLRDAACLENAPQWVKDAWATVAKEIGCDIDPHVDIATEAHEKFAHMAVQYFREGKSPTPLLTGVFQRFVRWLTDIYRAIVRSGDTAGCRRKSARSSIGCSPRKTKSAARS